MNKIWNILVNEINTRNNQVTFYSAVSDLKKKQKTLSDTELAKQIFQFLLIVPSPTQVKV